MTHLARGCTARSWTPEQAPDPARDADDEPLRCAIITVASSMAPMRISAACWLCTVMV